MTPRRLPFSAFVRPNIRPYTLGPDEDANLVGMRWYGEGPFHRELKLATRIQKKTHFVIREGDVIYNKLFAWKGAFGIVPASLDGMFVSDKFPTYFLDTATVNPRFLEWYFRAPALWEQARRMSTGSAAISKLTLNPPRFLELQAPVPSPSEQQAIVDTLDALAAMTRKARTLRSQADKESMALVRACLTQLTSGIEAAGTLADVLFEPPRNGWSARCDNMDDGTPVLTLSAVTGFHFDGTAFKRTSLPTDPDAHYWLEEGDLLMTRSNTPELVGHAAIYDGAPQPCIYPDLMMRLRVNEDRASKRFVWYWLQSPRVRQYVQRRAKGTSPTMKKISQPIAMQIPFPTHLGLQAQHAICEQLDLMQSRLTGLAPLQSEISTQLANLVPATVSRTFSSLLDRAAA